MYSIRDLTLSNVVRDRAMELTVSDGDTEQLVQTRASATEAVAGIDGPLLPSHIAAGRLSIPVHKDVPIHDPPIAMLAADQLDTLFVSRHVALTRSARTN